MTLAIAQPEMRYESTRPEVRRYVLTAAVLTLNLAIMLAPAAVGLLALAGVLR